MRVIIAEDEALIRMDLREMLLEEGHEVVGEAGDGASVVAMVRRLSPDVVFMDIEMPGMDGLDAARIISAEHLAPVVVVTAFSQEAYVERACEAGAMAYLVKPFAKADIVPAMHVAVSRFAESRQLAEEVEDLKERLSTRVLVDRAKAALMERGMSEPDAFRRLQKAAMDRRLTLRQVAEAVLLAEEAAEG
ncbi:MAG TPA: response regulator [Coriobacteriia bacterium]|nr:response regulator [Coriobacteriia bacterium]